MPSLIHALRTKGFVTTAKRVGFISSRYSFNGFSKSLESYIKAIEDHDAKVTFPITARVLERNIDLIKQARSKSIEWAMHGYTHTNYAKIEDVYTDIRKGCSIFKKAKVPIYGFRAPFINANEEVLEALIKNKFLYDSSTSYYVKGLIPESDSIKLILDFYKPKKEPEIRYFKGLPRIPLSLPDDEMMLDRLGFKPEQIGKVWIKMCKRIIKTKAVPVIQLHPERARNT